MDREILFKGFHPCKNGFEKVFVNGERIKGLWVEGAYMPHYYSSRYGKISAIFVNDDILGKTYRYPVIPETVGQYTGLTDKNDKKIFEGDIVTYKEKIYTVDWCDDCVSFVLPCINYPELETDFRPFYGTDLEVIGNIHDNPELLEVSE